MFENIKRNNKKNKRLYIKSKILFTMKHTKFDNPEIKAVYHRFPKPMQRKMFELRDIIFEVAKNNPKIGKITESLKWGEPTYETIKTKSGSPLKIIYKTAMDANFSLAVMSSTNLIETFKEIYPKTFYFNGTREVIINSNKKIPRNEIYKCIELALTYNLKNKK